ncbi:MAG: hypothetical protein BMS9Abin17_1730 [Acidimicrobiia bacterium]|nr:MAG: hypothetical protein BMS9Abin17_1730 [Acidimicrobiia bacterium]
MCTRYPCVVDVERYAQDQLDEAIAAGDLTPTVGVGEPIRNLTNDPDWWLRAFFERDRLPERHDEFETHVGSVLHEAIHTTDLADARKTLSAVNRHITTWNEQAPAEFQVEPRSEVWLITERAKLPGP